MVWREFHAGGDTIRFTLGRAPEFCSEAPRMIWKDADGREHRRSIPPLFNWNVDALWCTEHYLIFGLEASYEYGDHDERLAFWRLADAEVAISPGVGWDDSGAAARHEASLLLRLPGWREARIAEVDSGLVIAKGDTTMAFWPTWRLYSFEIRSSAWY